MTRILVSLLLLITANRLLAYGDEQDLTTGGGTAAEVITGAHLDRFRKWSNGCRVLLHDNNFASCSKVGAYEIDPRGPRSPHQNPAGFRDRRLYQRLWGTHWNGVPD